MHRRRVLLSAALMAVVLVSCGDDADDTPRPGIPNPASIFCEEQGGVVRIDTATDGSQSGICVLPDGTEVDEWELFRESQE
jgi:uncharacterized protein